MLNINVKRITISGKIARITTFTINKTTTYQVDIEKIDGGMWCVNIDEEMCKYLFEGFEAIFELVMVFEDDNIFGKVDSKLSKVEKIYVKGIEITEKEYKEQQELDKQWLLRSDNVRRNKMLRLAYIKSTLVIMVIIAIVCTGFAVYVWNKEVKDLREYKNYTVVMGRIVDREYLDSKYTRYDIVYSRKDGVEKIHSETVATIKNDIGTNAIEGDQIPILYGEIKGKVYIGCEDVLMKRFVPLTYMDLHGAYLYGIIAICFDMGLIAFFLMLINKTASKYFRLLIPIALAVLSTVLAVYRGPYFHMFTGIYLFIFGVMLFFRIKNGFKSSMKSRIHIGPYEI